MVNKNNERKYKIHHNILAENASVILSGEIVINNNLLYIDNYSGHYEPKKDCLNYLKDYL